jgi:putative oxidoreductase
MNKAYDWGSLVGRILIALIFILSGVTKITGYAGTQGYMESMGVPGALLPVVIVTELGGGILVMLGLWTRLAALALAGFCILAAVLFHANFSDQIQMIMFLKNLAIAGGFLTLFAQGAGALSLDARRARA